MVSIRSFELELIHDPLFVSFLLNYVPRFYLSFFLHGSRPSPIKPQKSSEKLPKLV